MGQVQVQNAAQNSTHPAQGSHIHINTNVSQTSWSSIHYYEFNERLGEAFNALRENDRIAIDGFTAPLSRDLGGGRFSLGLFSNINRKPDAEHARRLIGNGILLERQVEDGTACSYVVHNASDYPVFVQSAACSLKNQWHKATVVKVPADHKLQIFNERYFTDFMLMQKQRGYNEAANCIKLCTIRISFVKGWGERYRRQVSVENMH